MKNEDKVEEKDDRKKDGGRNRFIGESGRVM